MPKIPRSELLDLFFQETVSYIPAIRAGIKRLKTDPQRSVDMEELHRLFHNIKGAAAQVQLGELSQAARIVEAYLENLLLGSPVVFPSEAFPALEGTVELFDIYAGVKSFQEEDESLLHNKIAALFKSITQDDMGQAAAEPAEGEALEGQQRRARLVAVLSVLPLLQELADCLVTTGGHSEYNRTVYSKLSLAISTLAGTVRDAGLPRHHQLLVDFRQLLEKNCDPLLPQQPEMAGLITDFLGFLEVALDSPDADNRVHIQRVSDHLRRMSELQPVPAESRIVDKSDTVEGDDIFGSIDADDEAIGFIDDLIGNDVLGEESADDLFTHLGEADDAPLTPALVDQSSEKQEHLVDVVADVETLFEVIEEPQPAAADVEPPAFIDDDDVEIDEEQQLLMEIFHSECDEHLITINSSLNSLEQQVSEEMNITSPVREVVSTMRRSVHTLKGAAAITGVNLLAEGAHSLEDLLDWLHDEATTISPREIQIIAGGIDVIELLVQAPQAEGSERLDRLTEMIDSYLASRSMVEGTGRAVDPDGEYVAEGNAEEAKHRPDDTIEALPDELEFEDDASQILPGDAGMLRVRLEDLDELVSIEGELVVARGAMEKMLGEFSQTLVELDNVKENLRRKSQELEVGFEVQSLYGFNPAAASGEEVSQGGGLDEFDPIELDRYSQLNLIIRSLNEISVDVNSIHSTLVSLQGDISGQVGKQQLTMRLMQDKLMRIRMTPMSSISRVLFRTVRDTSQKLNKKVNLTITGEDVYMDRFVWAKITDPLMHVLRNCVDHGIEAVAERKSKEKPDAGSITVEAEQRSRFVILRVSDDGGGIDLDAVRMRLREENLVADPSTLGEKELIEYLFHPSFSTKKEISAVSGRGVGLDVVRRNILDLRGSVQLENKPGLGATFTFHIPFTLSVNRAIIVAVMDQLYAVPLQDIQQVRHFAAGEIEEKDGLILKVGEEEVPVANLGYYLQLEGKDTSKEMYGDGLLAILFQRGGETAAVSIGAVIEQREIIVKNLGSLLTHVHGISGVTLTGTGELIPILNLRELTDRQFTAPEFDLEQTLNLDLQKPMKVLIVDDSISVRHNVARLVESQSWQQEQAVDGMDALAKLENFTPDVIILDIEMPRMNGYEFKSSINANEVFREIPVIMLTSRVSEKHQQKARDLGVQHYLTKPYQEEDFIRLLESIRLDRY